MIRGTPPPDIQADLLSRRLGASRTKAWPVCFARHSSKRGPQANRVTLTSICRCNNSVGDDFEHQFRLAGVVELLAGRFESSNGLKFECCRL
jgi:hypothetical protein